MSLSRYAYEASKQIEGEGWPFYAVLAAAMRQADTENLTKLQAAFPEVWDTLLARYHAPGGHLKTDGGGS